MRRHGVIRFARVLLGASGVLRCRRCDSATASDPRDPESILATLRSVSDSWDGGPGPNVLFDGMEPFAHPALPMMVDAARRLGFERIRLRTDAGALASGGNAQGSVQAGVRQIEVVIMGAGAEHDALSGREGLFQAAVQGVEAFREAVGAAGGHGVVSAVVPVCRHNAAGLPQTVASCARLGAVSVCIEPVVGFMLDPALAHETVTAGAVNRMFVHGEGITPDRFAPWCLCEVAS